MVNILYFDIESAPNVGYSWGKWEQNIIDFTQESYLLCYAYAWNDEKVKVVSLTDFEGYVPHSTNDKALTQSLWELFEKADIIVAHNGNKFDIKYANKRFIENGLVPPSRYRTIDTLLVARNKFNFNSNKLDDLGKYLKLGRKVETGGFDLWLGCMKGDEKAWAKMKKYNKQDVVLLREVYYRLRSWMNNHPNLNIYETSDKPTCAVCQGTHLHKKGQEIRNNTIVHRWKCQNQECGANLYTTVKKVEDLKPA
jgi:RNase_H superfamily